jgi:hypothetical protein
VSERIYSSLNDYHLPPVLSIFLHFFFYSSIGFFSWLVFGQGDHRISNWRQKMVFSVWQMACEGQLISFNTLIDNNLNIG